MRSITLLLGLLVLLVAIGPSEEIRRTQRVKHIPQPKPQSEAPRDSPADPVQSEFDLTKEKVDWEFFKASNPRIRLLKEKLTLENAEPVTVPPPVQTDECGGCDKGQYCHQYFPECSANVQCAEVTYVCSPITTTTEAPAVNY